MKIRFILLLAMFFSFINTSAALAVMTPYSVVSWSADDMEVRNNTGYTVDNKTLTFVNPTTHINSTTVTSATRTYKDKEYTKAIKTDGATNQFTNGIPNHRAVSFEITNPCDLIIYAYGSSSSYVVNLCVSKKPEGSTIGEEIFNTPTQHSTIKQFKIFLDEPGTYYIYGRGGSISFCEIQRGCVKGDLDQDFDVDWNDIRIANRIYKDKIEKTDEYEYKLDLAENDVDGFNQSDLNELKSLLSAEELAKAEFVSSKVWNASSMPLGYYATYDGLEMVERELNINNRSINVANMPKTYVGNNGETKYFTRAIVTDGYFGEEKGNYCVTKAVKINLSQQGQLTIYMSTGSSENLEHKAVIYDADGNNVAEFPLTMEVGKYSVVLDGTQTYFIGSPTGTLRLFEIDFNAVSQAVSVEAGEQYSYILTGVNIPNKSSCTYVIKYNDEAISLNSLGENATVSSSFTTGDNIQVISHSDGILKFKYTEAEENWTGVLTVFKFTAKSTGKTTIAFEMEE